MEKLENKVRSCEGLDVYLQFVYTASGLWPKSKLKALKNLILFLNLICDFVGLVGISIFCLRNYSNVALISQSLGLGIGYSVTCMKIIIFVYHEDVVVHLQENLTKKFYKDIRDPACLPYMKIHRFKTFIRVAYPNLFAFFITRVLMSVGPLLRNDLSHVLPSIYPFEFEPGSLVYWIIYCFEALSCLSLSFVNAMADISFVVYALQMCSELGILKNRFKELNADHEDYKKKLKDCIQRHYLLIQAKNNVEKLYGTIMIWMLVSAAFILCCLMFQISEMKQSGTYSVYVFQIFSMMIPKSYQVFIYCWYGNSIITESDNCLSSVYDSNWTDSRDIRFKNDFLIISSQKPIAVVAKGTLIVQLGLFSKIMKASWSWFCVLRNFHENDNQ